MLLLFLVLVLTFPVMRALASRVEHSDGEPVEKLHRLQLMSLGLTFGLLVLVAAAAIELHQEKGALPGLWRGIPLIMLLAVAVALPVLLQFAMRPTYERLRGTAGTTRHVRRRTLRGVLVMLLPQLLWFGVLVGLSVGHANSGIRVAALLAWVVFLASCGPLLVRLALPTHSADARTLDVVNTMCSQLDVRIRDVRVIDTGHNPMANAAFSGFGPGPKYVFVTDKLLENFDDDEVRAVLAHEIGHRVKHHIAMKLGALLGGMVLIGGILFGLGALGGDLPHVAVFAVALMPIVVIVSLLVVQGAVGIKLEEQADDYAASVVGADATERALAKIAEQNMMKMRTGRLWNIMSQHPGMEQRIQRLRERNSSEQPSPA
jgi:Zn-dependent protease with chaperone function